jgi:hypothetical protein
LDDTRTAGHSFLWRREGDGNYWVIGLEVVIFLACNSSPNNLGNTWGLFLSTYQSNRAMPNANTKEKGTTEEKKRSKQPKGFSIEGMGSLLSISS